MNIKDCKAVITGGASGLGEATVRNIVQKGGKAIILDLAEERARNLQNELGEGVLFSKTDVTKEDEVKEALDYARKEFGEFNTLINCGNSSNLVFLRNFPKGVMRLSFDTAKTAPFCSAFCTIVRIL